MTTMTGIRCGKDFKTFNTLEMPVLIRTRISFYKKELCLKTKSDSKRV
jgi:hypothetical protein